LLRGDVIGESAVFSPKRRTTVLCKTFCEFYVLPIREIVAVLESAYPTTWITRWNDIVHDLKVSNKHHGAKYVRSVDFDLMRDDYAAASSPKAEERVMSDQLALSNSSNGDTAAMMDENGDTALIPNGVQAAPANVVPEASASSHIKKKKSMSIPFIGRRSSLSRNDQIITMAKRREQDHTYVTHDLGMAGPNLAPPSGHDHGSLSDDIGDIVPGIEHPDEAAVELAVQSRRSLEALDENEAVEVPGDGLLAPGQGSSKHPDVQPSVQVELSHIEQMEDDLDQVLSEM